MYTYAYASYVHFGIQASYVRLLQAEISETTHVYTRIHALYGRLLYILHHCGINLELGWQIICNNDYFYCIPFMSNTQSEFGDT